MFEGTFNSEDAAADGVTAVLVPFVAPDQFRLPMEWRVVAHIDGHTIKATAVVKVHGDLDSASVADLIETVASLMRPTCAELTIDLSGSGFISAGALQQLDEFVYEGSRQGSDKECIRIYGLSRTARRVVDVAALRHVAAVARDGQFDVLPSDHHPCYLGELTVVWRDGSQRRRQPRRRVRHRQRRQCAGGAGSRRRRQTCRPPSAHEPGRPSLHRRRWAYSSGSTIGSPPMVEPSRSATRRRA